MLFVSLKLRSHTHKNIARNFKYVTVIICQNLFQTECDRKTITFKVYVLESMDFLKNAKINVSIRTKKTHGNAFITFLLDSLGHSYKGNRDPSEMP